MAKQEKKTHILMAINRIAHRQRGAHLRAGTEDPDPDDGTDPVRVVHQTQPVDQSAEKG